MVVGGVTRSGVERGSGTGGPAGCRQVEGPRALVSRSEGAEPHTRRDTGPRSSARRPPGARAAVLWSCSSISEDLVMG